MYEMADFYKDHPSAEQADRHLYSTDIIHVAMAGLHLAKVICRANSDQYTIAIGLWNMLQKEYIDNWYTCFAAGAVLISVPIAALFLYMQRYYVDGLSGAVKG